MGVKRAMWGIGRIGLGGVWRAIVGTLGSGAGGLDAGGVVGAA